MAGPAPDAAMLMTPEEFLVLSVPDAKAELVRGELQVTPPAGGPHGCAATNLVLLLAAYCKGRGLGRVFADGTGYELIRLPRTVRVPDASFVCAARLPSEGIRPGLLRLAPDLAIEVLSPSETVSDIEDKVDDYRVSGTPLIWVVDPVRRTVMVIAGDAVRSLHENDELDGGDVVPGFACNVAEVFEGIAK